MIIKDTESVNAARPLGPCARISNSRVERAAMSSPCCCFRRSSRSPRAIRRAAAMFAGHRFVVAVPEISHELDAASTCWPMTRRAPSAATGTRSPRTPSGCWDADARAALDFLSPHRFRASWAPWGSVLVDIWRFVRRCSLTCWPPPLARDRYPQARPGGGAHNNSLDRIGEITGELLMIWGRQDPHIPREGRALIYNALSDAGTHFQWHEFNVAHAFLRNEGPRYDPAAARTVSMVLELSTRTLNTA